MKKAILFLVICVSFYKVQAWSLKTHLFIAQQVLNDVLDDRMVTLAGKKYAVPDNIYYALRDHPDKFRMGSLGPDVFPDFIVGQMTVHPGIPSGWKTDDWLKFLLSSAKTSEELAFCYGYVVHASSDIFAHTYVNMFAGDIFVLTDKERTVELRHFMLEKFIERYTPPILDNYGRPVDMQNSFSSPWSFLASTLILNEKVYKQHSLDEVSSSSGHLRSMFTVRNKVSDFADQVDVFVNLLTRFIADRKDYRNNLNTSLAILMSYKEDRKGHLTKMQQKSRQKDYSMNDRQELEKESKAYEQIVLQQKQIENDIADADAEINESDAMAGRLGGIIRLIKNWQKSIENSTELYIKAGDAAGIAMLSGEGNPLSSYTNWAKCHGWAFVAVPDIIPGTWCDFKDYLKSIQAEILKLEEYLPKIVQRFIQQIRIVKEYAINKIKPILLDQTEFLVTRALKQDAESADLAYYMMFNKDITQAKLDEIYSKDSSGKKLLKYKQVSKFVLADMVLNGGLYFNPNEFGPVANSLSLSKLALLGPKGLNELIVDNAGKSESALYGSPVYPEYAGNFTILFDAVTSIDGNHQWQPYPLPYPRESYVDQGYSFGYDYYKNPSEKKGFRIWVDPVLRSNVFLKIFNKSCLGTVSETLKANKYPFPECELNLFPSTIDGSGKKIAQDLGCQK